MAHEITSNDQVVLHSKPAWHGLGLVVPEALTPRQASEMVFPFTVIQKTPFYKGIKGEQKICEGFKINVRSDTGDQLGTVSENYKVVQPLDMADFCEALAENGDVRVETAGSIRSGARLWFLLKGEAFDVAHGDQIMPYVLVSNGYDGGSSFRVTPTTVRVVCSNTLHAVIPHMDSGDLGQSAISIRHTSNIMQRIEEAKFALAHYGKAMEGTKKVIDTLAKKEVTSDEVKAFFLECYQDLLGIEIPANPTNKFEENRRNKAMSAFSSFSKRFDDEKGIAGTTVWCMANAFSGLIQHDAKAKGLDDADRVEKKVDNNLFGLTQQRTQAAFAKAFKFALAK